MPKKKSECVWEKRKVCNDIYYIDHCKQMFNNTHNVDGFKFCPYCGRKIRIKESKENA